jgi:hypothetical protein
LTPRHVVCFGEEEAVVKSVAKVMASYAAQAVAWMRRPDYEMDLPLSEAGVRLLEDVPEWCDDGGTNGILEEMTMTYFLFEGDDEDTQFQTIATLFGSYLGEVLRRTCGGKWVSLRDKSGESVALEVGGMQFFPHQKVMKRLLGTGRRGRRGRRERLGLLSSHPGFMRREEADSGWSG